MPLFMAPAVLECLGCGILLFDDRLALQFANARASELFGFAPESLRHRQTHDIDALFLDAQGAPIPPDKRPLQAALVRREGLLGREVGLRRPDGTLCILSLNVAVLRGDDGAISGLVADFTDISPTKKFAAERQESEGRLLRFIGSMDEIAFEFDDEGRYRNVWAGDESLLKRPRREMLGKRLEEVVPPALAMQVRAALRRVQASGRPESLEYPLDVLGGIRWFLARISPIPPDEKGGTTFSFLARDITPRKELESSLLETQRRFRGLFDNAVTGMALIDLAGRCLEANLCLCEMLGTSPDELRQQPFANYSHPAELAAEMEQFQRLVRGEINAYRLEKRFIRKDGQVVWGHLNVSLLRNEKREPLYSIVLIENITRRKRIEAEKDRVMKELEAIFTAAADGIIFYDVPGKILRLNPAAQDILGFSARERKMEILDLYKLVRPRRPDGTRLPRDEAGICQALRGKAVKGEIVQVRLLDGRELWASFSGSPIFDDSGRQVGIVATFTDITRLRQLQERLENYLHVLAHDLRTPLTVISGYAEILQTALQNPVPAPDAQESVLSILRAAEQMQQMMEDLVDVGRLESGQITLYKDLIDLPHAIAAFLGRQQVAGGYRRVRVQVTAAVPAVRIGVHHFDRILGNLIDNALKYSDADQPVDIEVTGTDGQACLAVQDYGKGIAAEDLPHLFDRFYRADAGRAKASGTGLGLFITKGLVEAYGGTIQVQNEPEKGARFTLCLPAAEPQPPAETLSAAGEARQAGRQAPNIAVEPGGADPADPV